MVAPLFEAGRVWYPSDEKFSDEVIEEVASFPNGDHDDFCDSMTMALIRFARWSRVSGRRGRRDLYPHMDRLREYY